MSTQPMTQDDPMARSGARWCEQHQRWECSAKKTDHHASAIRGMPYCLHHVGKATALARAEGETKLAAWSLAASDGSRAVDLGQMITQLIMMTAQRVEVYGELLRLQVQASDYDGLVGRTFAAGRDGARVETGESPRGLARLEASERDRLAKYVKTAHDMGIADQQIVLAQGQAQQVVAAVRVMFDAAGSELLPAVKDVMLRAFLGALGVVPGQVES